MSYARIYSRASFGIEAPQVSVEVHLSNGLPALSIVGLASAEVKESKERVRSALLNSGFEFPAKRIIINLAPADLPKSGGRFDLAIAMGILVASGQVPEASINQKEFVSELSLSGDLKPVNGILAAALACVEKQRCLVIAQPNIEEATLSGNKQTLSSECLKHLVRDFLADDIEFCSNPLIAEEQEPAVCLSEIKGNEHAKRALVLAAIAGHNLLMVGSPGSGKTMMARSLIGLYPALPMSEARQVASLESISNQGFDSKGWNQVRLRSPHHSASRVAITGGGKVPTPGEISLAHLGLLFLDELPEFDRSVLESLRQPLEEGYLSISRANWKVRFPANFQLVAAMNP